MNYESLGAWVRGEREWRAADEVPGALYGHECLELHRLRKEVADLEVEREIHRKAAAAYFAKETTR